MPEQLLKLSDGVEVLFVRNSNFHTTLISYNFYLPLDSDSVASYGLLPFILTSCGKEYPDFSTLNRKLASLCGARLDASTEKYGDNQLLRMSISCINDNHSLDGDSIVKKSSELLLGLIFNPSVENEAFFQNDLMREKRKAIEHIKGEISEKRIYAKNRLIEEMFKGSAYGVPKCGTIPQVESITGNSLYKMWQRMLENAFVRVQVIGDAVPDGLFDEISEKFRSIKRDNITDYKSSAPVLPVNTPKTVTERMDIVQGKLCLGFSTEIYGNDDTSLPMMVMADIFGGGPYSKLFQNVREKMSLCYYCSAHPIRQKGLLTVDSGVESCNCEKALSEILNQFEILKSGDFSDFEFESSKKSIINSLNSYNDSQNSIDLWYAIKINNCNLYSPYDIAKMVEKITREDVINTANGVKLHTVYKLLPKETE